MTYAIQHALKKFPFVRLLLSLVTGIVLEWYLQFSSFMVFLVACIIFTLLIAFIFLSLSKRFILRWLEGVLIMLLFFAAGAYITYIKDIRHQGNWMGRYYQPGTAMRITLEEPLVEKNNSYKAIASVNAVEKNNEWIITSGNIIVYLQKDSSVQKLDYGSQLLIQKPLQPITNSGNPGAFDYNRYCLFQDITHQVYLKQNEFMVLIGKNTNWLKEKLYTIRSATIQTLQQYIHGDKEQGVAEALLIGYREDLDKELVQAYSNTGVVHIIAISGLHIGMIYALMMWLFSPLKKYKWTKFVRPIVLLFVLWSFTLVAGAVPSILRSAVMFTFIVIGQAVNRKTNIYNTLAASAFCMLAYNPFVLWDVGFLLSYAAVISIITFVKYVYNWIYFENKILDKIWALTSVTISAQILTIPLVIFYFHQFPTFFLITNLLVVPLSGLILYVEIFLLCISFIAGVATIVGNVLHALLYFMNSFIENVSNFPFSVWSNLQVNIFQTWLLYGFIVSLCIWLIRKYKIAFLISLACFTVFIISISTGLIERNKQQKLVVYNIPKHSAIDILQGSYFYYSGDADVLNDPSLQNFHFKPARVLFHTTDAKDTTEKFLSGHRITVHHTSFLLIDDSFTDPSSQNKIPVDVIVVSKNPRLDITQLQNEYSFKEIVFDSSNPLWKIERWKKDCDSLHLRFHSVPESGAFVIDL